MADDESSLLSEAAPVREFTAEAWVGEPDNRTFREFEEARGKLAFGILLTVMGSLALCAIALGIVRLAQFCYWFDLPLY